MPAVLQDRGEEREPRRPPRELPPAAATIARADAPFRGSGAMGSYRLACVPAFVRAFELLLRPAAGRKRREPDPCLRPSLPRGARVGPNRVLPCSAFRQNL